jgi:hypothetical protein
LWLIFAGILVYCIAIAITFSGQQSWRIYLSDQPIGAALIAIGVWQLGRVDIDREYTLTMRAILIFAILQIATTAVAFFPLSKDPLFQLFRSVLDLASTAAVVAFCIAMRWFCQDLALQRSARGWLKTTVVFCCACVPLAVSQFAGMLVVLKAIQIVPYSTAQQNLAGWFLLQILLIVAPPLAFLLSILQMRGQMTRRERYS